MKYRLIADSSCEMTGEIKKKLDAVTVPFAMTLGDFYYVDDEKLDMDVYVNKMNEYKGQMKSSCPAPDTYYNAFLPGEDVYNFVITISSRLSGSYNSALMAVQKAKGMNVHVFDSKSASAGETLIAQKLTEYIGAGLGADEIIARTEEFIKQMATIALVDNVENLVKNGRMKKIAGYVATILRIKPIIGSDGDGNIIFLSKAQGNNQAVQKFSALIGEKCADTSDKVLSVSHCNGGTQLDNFINTVRRDYHFKDIIITPTRGLSSMYCNDGGIIASF